MSCRSKNWARNGNLQKNKHEVSNFQFYFFGRQKLVIKYVKLMPSEVSGTWIIMTNIQMDLDLQSCIWRVGLMQMKILPTVPERSRVECGDMVKCPYRHSRGLVGVLQMQFNSCRVHCNLWNWMNLDQPLSRPASSSGEFWWWTRSVSRWSMVWSLWNKVQVSWYNLPSPSLPTFGCLQPLPPLLCPFCLHSAPALKHTCATYATALCPLSD